MHYAVMSKMIRHVENKLEKILYMFKYCICIIYTKKKYIYIYICHPYIKVYKELNLVMCQQANILRWLIKCRKYCSVKNLRSA